MGRHAHIIAVLPDAWGDLWDIRESRPTPWDWPLLIGWPHGWPRGRGGCGGPQVVLTAPLVEAVKTHKRQGEVSTLAQHLSINRATVRRLRVALGLDYYADIEQWWTDRLPELAILSLDAFARRHDTTASSASVWARRLGLDRRAEEYGYHRKPGVQALLSSSLSHQAVAVKLGKSLSTVRKLRWMLRCDGVTVPQQPRMDGRPMLPQTRAALMAAAKRPKTPSHRRAIRLANMRAVEYIYHYRIDDMASSPDAAERWHAAISMYLDGWTLEEIAAETGYKHTSAIAAIIARIIARRRTRKTKEQP